ncbi:transporter substrate-binding domain-containing diguanylate cyclase [Pseudoflavonifractor phocaeensis]|uniref:transporter substrate-binding domain-containing diguanylate cyclase n=1 Tax=Pseudoflavonifractor phocaeensis TaxID=1870988 RepID=UPI002108D251|nr:transporter substrate-binding domain-containing protein [Pseudoflavonifractor phocaeensis]
MKKIRRAAGLLLAVMLLAVCAGGAALGAGSRDLPKSGRTVRVGYPVQKGITDVDEDGEYTGYTYEYLEEVAQYTGWDYEFVQVPGGQNESLLTLLEMLSGGGIDLLGGMIYTEQMGELYDYASHSYGVGETVLQTSLDNSEDVVINAQIPQTFRVAVVSGASRSIQALEDYFAINMTTPEYVYCDSDAEQLRALEEGRADMLLNSSMNYLEGVRTVARFNSKPFYFITTKGADGGLMEELNAAIMSIEQTDPYFTTRLLEKYFGPAEEKLTLSQAERAYVESAGALRVGILTEQPPYQYREDGALRGVSVDLLDYVAEQTGLQFELVACDTPEELSNLAGSGGVDLVASMPYDYDLARQRGLSMTRPYLSAQYVIITGEKDGGAAGQGRRLAQTTFAEWDGKGWEAEEILRYATTSECIRAVLDGEADFTYVDTYTAQYYINSPEYWSLKMIPLGDQDRSVSFGVVKPGSRELLSILNKAVLTIPEADMQGIVNQNLLRRQPATLAELIRQNPLGVVLTVGSVAGIIIAVLVFFLWQRAKMNRKNALELEKHFRVYALVNEYFFEYDYRTGIMVVSSPPKDGGDGPELIESDLNAETETPEGEERRARFRAIVASGESGTREAFFNCVDGRDHWLRFALETVFDGDAPAYTLGKINIIDEEMREKEALLERAQMDSLTNLYNAGTFRHLVCEDLAGLAAGEHGGLLLIDVDHFKAINDTYGHMRGDEALGQVAGLLRGSFRAEDIVGRPGGDEFAVYMRAVKDERSLADKCGDLCRRLRGLSPEDGMHLTISIGAVLAGQGDGYEEIYALADRALYTAKEQGRNGFSVAERAAGNET